MDKFFKLDQSGDRKIEQKEKIQQPEKSKEEEKDMEAELKKLEEGLKPEEDDILPERPSADFDNSRFYEQDQRSLEIKKDAQQRLKEEKEKILRFKNKK